MKVLAVRARSHIAQPCVAAAFEEASEFQLARERFRGVIDAVPVYVPAAARIN